MKLEKVTPGTDRPAKRWYDDACGTALAMEVIGERWALLIVRELMFGPRRFGEIRSNLPGISANVLTQRLEGLAGVGIVVRRKLRSPANVQVYDLTAWGREAEDLICVMGRWAARSSRHDPFAFMSTASAMLSLPAMMKGTRAPDAAMTVGFVFPDDAFVVRFADGRLDIVRGTPDAADVAFTGDMMAFRRTIYGKRGVDGDGLLAMTGDAVTARRFIDLFELPQKIA